MHASIFLIKLDQKLIYGKLSALRRWTRETISSWIWEKWESPLACLYDIVKPFSITFLCAIAVLFEHNGVFHLIWWWFKAFLHPIYNMNYALSAQGSHLRLDCCDFHCCCGWRSFTLGNGEGSCQKIISFHFTWQLPVKFKWWHSKTTITGCL